MSQVKGFVGVRRRVFYHHQWRLLCNRLLTIMRIGIYLVEYVNPCIAAYGEVQETLHYVISADGRAMFFEVLSDFLSCCLRGFL